MSDKSPQEPTTEQHAVMAALLRRIPTKADEWAMFEALVDLEAYLQLDAGHGLASCFRCHRIGKTGTHDHEPTCCFRLIYPEAAS
jgi:cytochrome c553